MMLRRAQRMYIFWNLTYQIDRKLKEKECIVMEAIEKAVEEVIAATEPEWELELEM